MIGKGAGQAKDCIAEHGGLPFDGGPQGMLLLHIVQLYKHMGSASRPGCDPKPEVARRIGEAGTALRGLSRRILAQPCLPVNIKHAFVESLSSSKLFYNAGGWQPLPTCLLRKIDAFRVNVWRRERRLQKAGRDHDDRAADAQT